ncbi:hypothetical protein ACA910_020242 [Epithemia clementina (nom. ined.)]
MVESCSPACGTCKELHSDTRCAADPDEPIVWGPGDLDQMFERIVETSCNGNFTSGSNFNTNQFEYTFTNEA